MDAYIEAGKIEKRKCALSTARVNGCRLADKLSMEIKNAINLKKAIVEAEGVKKRIEHANKIKEAEVKENIIYIQKVRKQKTKQEIKKVKEENKKEGKKPITHSAIFQQIQGHLKNKEGVLQARSLLFQKGMEEFEWASGTDNPQYKAVMFKSLVDLVKLEAPEKVDLTKIDYGKPTHEIFKDVMTTLGSNEKTIDVFLKGFGDMVKKEISETKELSNMMKQVEGFNE